MPTFLDQIGKYVEIPETPKRIISIVPSQTEYLCDLGLENQISGVTKFCVHPAEITRVKTKVGGTKKINISAVKSLRPDFIIANKEENEREQVEELEHICPVWTSNIQNLNDAFQMMKSLGNLLQVEGRADKIISKIEAAFVKYRHSKSVWPRDTTMKSAAYLIWRNPIMVAGGDTFIHSMIEECGFRNVFQNRSRYPLVSLVELLECDILLLSSEPYPFKQKHVEEFREEFKKMNGGAGFPKIDLVDGEIFSWYGSRLALAPSYFENLMKKFVAV